MIKNEKICPKNIIAACYVKINKQQQKNYTNCKLKELIKVFKEENIKIIQQKSE